MALLKSKINNTTYSWKSDDVRDAEMSAIVNNYGAKNLLQNSIRIQTINGVTFTVNSDGSVTANGTAEDEAVFWLNPGATYKFQYDVKVNGIPNGSSVNTFFFGGYWTEQQFTEFTVPANTGFNLAIVIAKNYNCNNLTFYPMIRDARIIDSTYVPYAMTNREITQKLWIILQSVNQLDQVK